MIGIIKGIIIVIINIACILIFVAFFTTFERKIMGAIQRRVGPDQIGKYGLLQPFADGLKLILKETIVTKESAGRYFKLGPILTFGLSLIGWGLLPMTEEGGLSSIENSIILYLAIGSLGIYGIIIAGWASNSKYAFLGCIRSTAQMISYEVIFSFTLFPIFILNNSSTLMRINEINSTVDYTTGLYLYPTAIVLLIGGLAETNRTPFDLPEAEAELIAGYNIEYSSLAFALFFLGEYANMGALGILFTIVYLNGYKGINEYEGELMNLINQAGTIALKTIIICFFLIWIRATLPRYRYDQLITLCWTKLLPVTITYFLLLTSYIIINIYRFMKF